MVAVSANDLVRCSVTEAALTFRFEAADRSGLDRLVRRFCGALPRLGDGLWARYKAEVADRA